MSGKQRRAVPRSSGRENGSALLIVFVFAAIIAISLYMEMPVAVFEAKRQKEQLLIDRGQEYAHAVKLFVRKTGQYPPSLDALESTNNMRFLRRRFKDPFTGKDDWRLLHAGPGGILIDSKSTHTNPLGPGMSKGTQSASNTASFGSSSSFGSDNGQQGFGSGFSNSDSSSKSQPEVIVPPVPQRAPAIAANGSGAAPADAAPAQDPTQSLVPAQATEQTQAEAATSATPATQAASPGANDQTNNSGLAAGSTTPAPTGNAKLMQNMVGLAGRAAAQGGSGPMGQIAGGGIAGVASKAGGHSIKLVNEEEDYSKWEFYYDPRKDLTAALGQMGMPTPGVQTNGAPGFSQQNSPTQSIFANSPTAPAANTPSTNQTPVPQPTSNPQ